MVGLSQSGIATVTVIAAVVAVAGGTVGTPVAVDEIDTLPDSPFYGLERLGEDIKEAFVGGQGFDVDRAEERASEFVAMADRGKAQEYLGLVDEAGDRLDSAIRRAGDAEGLEVARDAVNKHIAVLENVLEKVPDAAKPAISLVISRSARGAEVIADVKAGELPMGDAVRSRLSEIKSYVEAVRSEAEDNLSAGMSAAEIVQNIEIDAAEGLIEKFVSMAENKGEDYLELVELAQNRLDAAIRAATDNYGLNKALEASQKHLDALENVLDKAPEVAQSSIQQAINWSQQHVSVLENVQSDLEEGTITDVTEALEEMLPQHGMGATPL